MKTPLRRLRVLLCTPTILVLLAASASTVVAKDRGASRSPLLFAKFADGPMAADALANTADAWTNIKDYPYEKRVDFTAVFSRMVAKLDDNIRALNEKRATMTNDTKEWDFAMKELNNARSDVQSKLTDLSKATAETWEESRDRVGVAWDRVQTAVHNVKVSTTS